MSAYLRAPGVSRVTIKPYPKRRKSGPLTLGEPVAPRPVAPTAGLSVPEPCYADFFRAERLEMAPARVA